MELLLVVQAELIAAISGKE